MKKSMVLVRLNAMKSEIELLIKHFETEFTIEAQAERESKEEKNFSSGKRWSKEEDAIIIKAADNKDIDLDMLAVELYPERTKKSIASRVYLLGMRVHYNRILTSQKGLKS